MIKKKKILGTDILPNRKRLITHTTMQGLCLDNNKGEKAVNSNLMSTPDGALPAYRTTE